jgi:hypothetical protein
MKIDVEKIKTAYEAASAEQKEQIEKMFPGAFECAKSEDSEETLETLVDKFKTWQNQNADKRAVVLFASDKDRTKEQGNTSICIAGPLTMLLKMALGISASDDIQNPLAKLFALALMSKIKDNIDNIDDIEDSKHGTDN